MPSIKSELATFLRADPSIGVTFAGAIYNARKARDTGTLAITIRRSGGEHNYHLRGETDLMFAFLTLTLHGHEVSPELLETLGEEIRQLLSAFHGTWGQTIVTSCTYLSDTDSATQPFDASDYWQFRLVNVMQVNHKQTPIFRS